jgi:hypothetical protein
LKTSLKQYCITFEPPFQSDADLFDLFTNEKAYADGFYKLAAKSESS